METIKQGPDKLSLRETPPAWQLLQPPVTQENGSRGHEGIIGKNAGELWPYSREGGSSYTKDSDDERSMERDLVRVLRGNSTTRIVNRLQGDRKRHRRTLRHRNRRARPLPPENDGMRRHISYGQAKGPRGTRSRST